MIRRFRKRGWLLPAVLLLASPVWSQDAGEVAAAFREVSTDWGLEFHHRHGGSGEFYMIETMGSGVAVFDFDGDGDDDVLFVDSGELPGYTGPEGRSRLFRNDGGGSFRDWTTQSGLELAVYGMGATAGDIDGDGDLDLYVTAFGENQLLVNDGAGHFERAPEGHAAAGSSWSTSAAFSDVDRDGDLDLYVANYVDFAIENNKPCGDLTRGLRSYCHPDAYDGLGDRFYRNGGQGRFVDATEESGFGGASGKGLGVAFFDENLDRWPELYVANDMTANFLFRNSGGRFVDVALASGAAYSGQGEPEAGMGIAVGDLDGDGRPELLVTHLDNQTNALYSLSKEGFYFDRRESSGLAGPSFHKVGFGAAFADWDQDGDLDVSIANGHIIHNIEEWGRNTSYRQRNQILLNDGHARLEESATSGLEVVRSSRGLATADFDLDGDLDLVITNSNDLAEVYRNDSASGRWLSVELRGSGANRFGIGARVEVGLGTDLRQVREIAAGSSYLSQHTLSAHFGLGAESTAEISVRWPSGKDQTFAELPGERRVMLFEPPRCGRESS